MKPIKSIEEELADCRQAFAEHPDAKTVWCCHHEVLVEELTDPFEARISYILSDKPEEERAVRFRNFRPVKNEATIARPYKDYKTAVAKAMEGYNAAIAKPWEDYQTANAKAMEGYNAAIEKAMMNRETAINKPREAYDAAKAQAWKDYSAATAKALEVYYATIAKAWKDYQTAVAKPKEDYQTACKLAEKPLVDLLNQEWPDHTWNEGSIF